MKAETDASGRPTAAGWSSLCLLAAVVVFSTQHGCGASGDGSPLPPAPSGSADDARVQQFLDSRYRANEVRRSFTTAFGETIDCVDFESLPAVEALQLAGKEVPATATVTRRNAERNANRGPRSEFEFDGRPDANGSARACPAGTVPELRVTAEDIRQAGGLDAYRASGKNSPPAAGNCPTPQNELTGYAHVVTNYTGSFTAVNEAVATLSTFETAAPGGGHNVSQVWVYTGTGFNFDGKTCTKNVDCIESVEAGLIVNGGAAPTFFVFTTPDGYTTNCFNGDTSSGCPKWVQAANPPVVPGAALPASVPGGKQHEIALTIENSGGAWYVSLSLDGGPYGVVGSFVAGSYTEGMQNAATQFQVGGEVADSSDGGWSVPLGTGGDPAAGFRQAAYAYNFTACSFDVDSESCDNTFSMCGSSVPNYYTFSNAAAPSGGSGSGPWINSFYFGNNPRRFWGANSGYEWSPDGDWANGSFKGECGIDTSTNMGEPVVGVSEYPNLQPAHSVRCGTTEYSMTPSGCYPRAFGPNSDNRGVPGEAAWDPRYYMGECAANEYVAGVAQGGPPVSHPGYLDAILCCPGGRSHLSCNTEVFHNSNSGSYTSPDWDDGYYKGQCAPGKYVAGVSGVNTTSQGIVGSAHAILCCQ